MFVIDLDIVTNKAYTVKAWSQGQSIWLKRNQSITPNSQECQAWSKAVEKETSLSSS